MLFLLVFILNNDTFEIPLQTYTKTSIDMSEPLTVEKALRRGVNYLVVLPILTFPTIAICTCLYMKSINCTAIEIALTGVFIFIFLTALYWGYGVTQWRLWAFGNVRNVHELKRKAIKQNIIYRNDNFFTKTEIWTKADKLKWQQIRQKFKEADLFLDDTTIPEESIIYFSRRKNLSQMALGIVLLGMGIYGLLNSNNQLLGITIALIIGTYITYSEWKEVMNTKVQIRMNEEGLKTSKTPFYSWDLISGENIISTGSGKYPSFYLEYRHPKGRESFLVDDLDMEPTQIEKLFEVYRGRYNQTKDMNKSSQYKK